MDRPVSLDPRKLVYSSALGPGWYSQSQPPTEYGIVRGIDAEEGKNQLPLVLFCSVSATAQSFVKQTSRNSISCCPLNFVCDDLMSLKFRGYLDWS